MQPDFQTRFGVSRETADQLAAYHALLLKWQKAINLVSNSTLEEAWERHFADSAQLAQYIPQGIKTTADLGSGAGFPGLVLAIMRPDIETHLVESDERKAQFLRTVSRETGIKVTVHDSRIEDVAARLSPDLVTARALASLDQLLGYCFSWAEKNPNLVMLFLKGQGFDAELREARKRFRFKEENHASLTSAEARILRISALSAI